MEKKRTIHVKGTGTASVPPDYITLTLELEAKNKELEEKLSKLEKSSEGKNKELSGRVEEVYNSLPFRMYRKMRDKKDGKKDE